MSRTILEQPTFDKLIQCMTAEILLAYKGKELPVLLGIRTRGATLAKRIALEMKKYSGVPEILVGFLDISFYRDDLTKIADNPILRDALSGDFEDFCENLMKAASLRDRPILLIDDVLYTGRTTKAALDLIVEHGRPREVKLAVFIDRGHRELPIEANFVGLKVSTTDTEVIHVHCKEYDGVDNVEISDRKTFQEDLDDAFPLHCVRCRKRVKNDDRYGFDDYIICEDCLIDKTVYCIKHRVPVLECQCHRLFTNGTQPCTGHINIPTNGLDKP
jgi:pyrimidine operon attenuation protein / uracil phosphoribosyltransferase